MDLSISWEITMNTVGEYYEYCGGRILSILWENTMNTLGEYYEYCGRILWILWENTMLETFDKLSDNNNNKNSALKEEGTSDMEELDDLQ